ncbi:MAG: polysaccharide deacetylase family protein [Armatimonadota bacterium]
MKMKIKIRHIVLLLLLASLSGAVMTQPTPKPVNPIVERPNDPDKFWQHAKKEVDKSVQEILGQNQAESLHGIRYSKIIRGNPGLKEIALTFDDGPHPQFAIPILKTLKRYNAKATFFVVGEKAEERPDLIRAEVRDGHQIGNHTYHHVNLTKIPTAYIATEIKACGEVVRSITGRAPHVFRPPGGDYDGDVASAAQRLGYTIVLWTDDPGDYASPGTAIITNRTLARLSNGGILLLHDGVQQTVNILPALIESLQARGYKLVTVDQLLAHRTLKAPKVRS